MEDEIITIKLERSISIVWNIEDIKGFRPDLNDNECFQVLLEAQEEHDANIGVNWEVLEEIATRVYPEAN